MSRIARLLRDNALGLVAITIALSAGAYAVDKAPKDSVVSSSIRNGSAKGVDVKDDSLTGQDINESTLALPSDAGGTVTSVTAGSGLEGGTITQTGTISFKSCPASQVLKSTGPGYGCAADVDTDTNTTYSASNTQGLDLSGTTFGLKACPGGQVLKSATTSWICAPDVDTDTNTTYSAGSGLQLGGTTFSLAPVTAGTLGFVKTADFGATSIVNGTCISATIQQTAQFAPGNEGDFTVMSSFPALPARWVLAGQVGPSSGGFRSYFLSACNLTGSNSAIPATTLKMLVISQ